MSITSYKVTTFTFNHKDQIDELYLTYPNSLDIKKAFDSRCEDIQTKYNSLIDALLGTTSGDSGAKNIGVTTIPGVTGTEVQTVLESLKTAIDNAATGSIPDNSLAGTKLIDSTITYDKIGSGQIKRVNLEDYVINRMKIADGEVTQIKLQTYVGAGTGISTNKIADSAVTNQKLADDSVDSRVIADNSVGEAALQTASVGSTALKSGAVLEEKLGDLSVSTRTIQDGSVTAAKIDPAAIDLRIINRERANVNGYLDSLSLAIPSNTIYDYFEGSNSLSLGKIDNFYTTTTAGYNIGIDTISVIDTTGLSAGMEVTVQGEDLATPGQINKESLIILSVVSGTSLQFTTALIHSYATSAMVYRSFYAPRTELNNGLQFPEYRRTGAGFGAKSTNPSGLIGYNNCIAFSRNGKWIATGGQTSPYYQIIPFNQSTGVMGTPITQTVVLPGVCDGIKFSLDGKYIVFGHVGSPYLSIRNFNDTTGVVGTVTDVTLILPPNKVNKFNFDHTGNYIGLCGDGAVGENRAIAIYNFEQITGTNPSKFNDSSGTATYTATSTRSIFTNNNKYLITSYAGNPALNIFRIDTVARTVVGRVSYAAPYNNCDARGCDISNDNKYIVVGYVKNPSGSDNFAVYRFNAETGQIGAKLTIPSYPTVDVKGVKFSYDDKMIIVLHSATPFTTAYRFDAATETITALGSPASPLTDDGLDVDISPNNKYIAFASYGAEYVGVYAFESTKVNLLSSIDLRYKVTVSSNVKTLRISIVYEKDAALSANCYASIGTTTTENYVAMTKTIIPIDSNLEEAQFEYAATTPGTNVYFKITPTRSSTSVDKQLIKILGYVE